MCESEHVASAVRPGTELDPVKNRKSETDNSLHDPSHPHWFYRACRTIARIATTLMFDLKVYGSQHVPTHGGAIIAANHQSYLDPVLVGVLLRRPLSFMAKSTLFRNRYFTWLISALHAFPVRLGAGDVSAMKEAIRRVQQGHLLCVYPEGTRTETGELGPIQAGVALVVKRAGVPVVPAVIDGAFDAFGPHRKLPRPTRILLMYGPPMHFEGLKGEQITALIDTTFRQMLDELAQIRLELQQRSAPWQKHNVPAK